MRKKVHGTRFTVPRTPPVAAFERFQFIARHVYLQERYPVEEFFVKEFIERCNLDPLQVRFFRAGKEFALFGGDW